jgi:hypothetical protein
MLTANSWTASKVEQGQEDTGRECYIKIQSCS